MKIISRFLIACGLFASALPAAAFPPATGYYSITYDTAKGTATLQLAGDVTVAPSSATLRSGAVISLAGTSGLISTTYGIKAATAAFGSGANISTFATTGALSLASGAALTLSGANGNVTSASSVTASGFFGNGAGLTGVTALDSSKVAKAGDTMTGTLNMTNVGVTLTGANGNVTSASSVTASGFFGSGAGLTDVGGGVSLGADNTFTGANTFSSTVAINGYAPGLCVTIASAAASAISTITFETGGGAGKYLLNFNLTQNTSDAMPAIRINGNSSGVYYWIMRYSNFPNASETIGNINSATTYRLAYDNVTGVDTDGILAGDVNIDVLNFATAKTKARLNTQTLYSQSNDASKSTFETTGFFDGTTVITQISFYVSAGTFTGTLDLKKCYAK